MSDFWVKKMKTYFGRIDFDKDGSVTRKDFVAMGDRFAESGFLDGAKADHLKKALTDIWDVNLKAAGHNVEALDETAFVSVMKEVVFDKSHEDVLRGPLPLFFVAVDANQDGNIEPDEYKKFFRTLGMDESLAEAAFKDIDENSDGVLSVEEFVTAGVQFFTSQEDDCTKHFWGALV